MTLTADGENDQDPKDPKLTELTEDVKDIPKEGKEDDERLAADEALEAEGEARESHGNRRERQRRAIHRDKTELNYLRTQNEQLESRLRNVERASVSSHIDTVEGRIEQARQQIQLADDVIAKAISAGNGDDASKGMRIRDQLRDQLSQMEVHKARTAESQTERAAPKVNPHVVRLAQGFVDRNPWYDPRGGDEESLMVLAIDTRLSNEGLDPKSDEYWSELEKRVAKRLPHRFKNDDEGDEGDRKGPKMPAGTNGRANGGAKFYINPARKQALIDAGVWDDPVLRDKYVKKYMSWDKEHAAESRA